MKIIKTYESYNNFEDLNLGRFKYCIDKNLLIPNSDGTYNYNGDINFGLMDLNSLLEIPIRFKRIYGNFYCSYNNLISLEGSPEFVNGFFSCSDNELISLQYAPLGVGGNFNCSRNFLISNLCLTEIQGEFEAGLCLTEIQGGFDNNGNPFEITDYIDYVIETVKKMIFEQQMKELDFFKQNDLKAFEMMKEVLDTLGVNYGAGTRSMVGVMNKDFTNAKEMF